MKTPETRQGRIFLITFFPMLLVVLVTSLKAPIFTAIVGIIYFGLFVRFLVKTVLK